MVKLAKLLIPLIAVFICSNKVAIAQNFQYKVINKTIVVDADTTDWNSVRSNRIFESGHLWVGQGMYKENWKGPADLSFTWKAVRQHDKIYFLFVVTDDVISKFDQPNTWLNDCVEICLDPNNSKGIRKETKNGKTILHGYELHFLPSLPPHAFLHDDQSLYFTDKNQDKDFKNDWNGEIAVKYTKSGYIIELAFSVPNLKLALDSKIGIEIAVCDDDGSGRKSLLTWTGQQHDYWISMDKYGELTFK